MPAEILSHYSPLPLDWTVRQFLETLTEDQAVEAASLDLLLAVESGLIEHGAGGSPALPWLQTPGTVAVIRSIAQLMRVDSSLRSVTLGELLSSRGKAQAPTRAAEMSPAALS